MPTPRTSTRTAPIYPWGAGCTGWHLVQRPETGVVQETMPPGTAKARHYHERARQFFYVLRGEGAFELNSTTLRLAPGEGAEVPPGQPHRLRSEASQPLEFLVVSMPHTHGDRVLAQPA